MKAVSRRRKRRRRRRKDDLFRVSIRVDIGD
jgi:hypothetical protein